MVLPCACLIRIRRIHAGLLACNDAYHRLCPVAQAHFLLRAGSYVEHIHVRHGTLFAGHLVFIGLQCGARLRHDIDNPKVLDLAHVADNAHEILGIRAPVAVGHLAARGIHLGVAAIAHRLALHREAKVLDAVFRQLNLGNGTVLRILLDALVVGVAHHIQVIVLGIDHPLLVGTHIAKALCGALTLFLA